MEPRGRLAELFRELGTIEYGDINLVSGRKSYYKIHADPVLRSDEGRRLLAQLTLSELPDSGYKLAGVYRGGWEFARIIAEQTKASLICANPHTLQVSGDSLVGGDYVIILEDVTTVGSSIGRCLELLRQRGATVDCAIAIVDREEGAVSNLAAKGLALKPLLTKSNLGIAEPDRNRKGA